MKGAAEKNENGRRFFVNTDVDEYDDDNEDTAVGRLTVVPQAVDGAGTATNATRKEEGLIVLASKKGVPCRCD